MTSRSSKVGNSTDSSAKQQDLPAARSQSRSLALPGEGVLLWLRIAGTVLIIVGGIDDAARLLDRPMHLLTLTAGAITAIFALWAPRLSVLAFWITLGIALYSGRFTSLMVAGPIMIIGISLTRRWGYIAAGLGAWLLFGVITIDRHNGVVLWVMTPVVLFLVGVGVLLGNLAARKAETASAVRQALVLFEDEARRQRVALASRLHDEIGHALAKAALISSEGQSNASPADATHFEAIRQACAEGAEHLAELVAFLREDSGTLDDQESLPSQVLTKLIETLRSCGFSVMSDEAEGLDRYPELLHPLFNRFLLETTTNALKHSGPAREVRYEFVLAPDSFDIAVRNSVRPSSGEGQGHGLTGLAAAAKRLRCGLAWGASGNEWTVRLVGDLDEVVGEGFLVASPAE